MTLQDLLDLYVGNCSRTDVIPTKTHSQVTSGYHKGLAAYDKLLDVETLSPRALALLQLVLCLAPVGLVNIHKFCLGEC